MSQEDSLNHAGAGSPPHAGSSGPNVWEILWQRKGHVFLGVAVGLVLGVLFYAMAPRKYESTAQIFVVKKQPDRPISATPTQGGGTATPPPVEDFLDTHQTILKSTVVVQRAMDKGRLLELPTFQSSTRPARDLVDNMKVGRDQDRSAVHASTSQVINISFRGRYADDCQQVLGAVVESYHDFLNNSSRGSATEALRLITKARDLVQNDLKHDEEAYAEFRRKTPVLWKTQQGTTLYQERLGTIDAQRASLMLRVAQIDATLAAVEKAIKEGRPREELLPMLAPSGRTLTVAQVPQPNRRTATPSVPEEASFAATATTLEQELIQLRLEENRLLSDFGQRHPKVQAIRERIQTIRALLAPATTSPAKSEEQRQSDRRAKETLVDLKLAQLKQEREENRRGAEALASLFQTELKEAQKVFPYEAQDDAMRRSIDQTYQLYKSTIQRLKELDLISNFGGFDAQVITPPTTAEKVSPRAAIVLPMAALLGLLLGCGLAFLVELTDRSFRSPEDVRRRLGLPVLGVIPVHKPAGRAANGVPAGQAAALSPALLAWYRSKSREAEAYRSVRTALYFSTRGQGFKVIQVTSPNAGDGKSTLVANLAISIAQSGRRVLLVDADLRRPRLDKLFGLTNPLGLTALLEDRAEPADEILETGIAGLSLLVSGEPPANPAELLTSPRLAELLAWMRDHYDYVLIDTPPLLAVTDPGVIGPRVDGVLLTLRPTKNGQVDAVRAREVLHNLGVNVLGVIVNAAELNQGRYGYYSDGGGYYDDEGQGGTVATVPPRVGESAAKKPESNGAAQTADKE